MFCFILSDGLESPTLALFSVTLSRDLATKPLVGLLLKNLHFQSKMKIESLMGIYDWGLALLVHLCGDVTVLFLSHFHLCGKCIVLYWSVIYCSSYCNSGETVTIVGDHDPSLMKYFDCTRSGPRSAFDGNVVYQFEIMEYVSWIFVLSIVTFSNNLHTSQ